MCSGGAQTWRPHLMLSAFGPVDFIASWRTLNYDSLNRSSGSRNTRPKSGWSSSFPMAVVQRVRCCAAAIGLKGRFFPRSKRCAKR